MSAAQPVALASRLGFRDAQIIQEIGWDSDVDEGLRTAVAAATGTELVDQDHSDVVDAVVLWWRDEDGDLVDALVDALTDLTDGGFIWLLTPKIGRPGHVDPGDVAEAAPTAGLASTTSLSVSPDWSGTKLVAPRTKTRR